MVFNTSLYTQNGSYQAVRDLIPLSRVSQHLRHKLAEDIGGLLVTDRHCRNIDTAQTAGLRGSSCSESHDEPSEL